MESFFAVDLMPALGFKVLNQSSLCSLNRTQELFKSEEVHTVSSYWISSRFLKEL